MREQIKLYTLVFNHFKDDDKTNLWFKTPNPNLGNVSPNQMIDMGRGHKVQQFIETAIELNTPASNADSVDELAEKFHECYERLAPQFNYETTQASRTDWANVPENNKKLMRAVCKEVVADTITQLKATNKAQANEIKHLSKQYLELLSETSEAKITREVN
tara:strand:+ start:3864 stop:4346 length:483 start_codon:yes stop_codon:yes gene_type:complete